MKKTLLTVCAAALFTIAVNAQDKDSTRTESNQFRNSEQKENKTADEAIDSASTDFKQGVNDAERDAEKAGDNIREEKENVREGVNETAEDVKEGVERTGDKIEQTTEKAGDDIKKGVKRTDDQMERSTEKAAEEIKQDPNGDNTEGNKTTESTEPNQQASANFKSSSQIEVVEAKEGPANQVVYKYQGGFYYVDREEKKLVKIEESELSDSDEKIIINEGKNKK